MALTTLSELKTFLGISDSTQDANLEIIRAGVEQEVKIRIKRSLEKAEYIEVVLFANGLGVIDETPIDSITLITNDDGFTYDVDWFASGIIKLATDYTGRVTVVYTGGYASTPADIKLAVLKLAEFYYNKPTGVEAYSFDNINARYSLFAEVSTVDRYMVRRL